MKASTKSVLVLVLTLMVGIAIGAVSWSIVHNQRMEKLRQMRREGGMYGLIDKYVDPSDSAQETALRSIADRYQANLELLYGEARKERNAVLDSMRAELRTILTPAQQQAMAEWLDRPSRDKAATQ